MDGVRRALGEALAFVLPVSCPGCDEIGTRLCESCRLLLSPAPRERSLPGDLVVHTALRYEGVPSRVVRALKEHGRTDLARALAPAVRAALAAADPDRAIIVPVPTSRRSMRARGYRVPDLLARRSGAAVAPLLRLAARVGDQRGLDRDERARNVVLAMRARRAAGRGDGPLVLFDDVVTTGATMREAARALREAGFEVRGCAAVAATPLRAARRPHDEPTLPTRTAAVRQDRRAGSEVGRMSRQAEIG